MSTAFDSLADFTHSRMLQRKLLSELDIEMFCERYVPSARVAFGSSLSKYEYSINSKILDLSVEEIIQAMNNWHSVMIGDDLPHHIFIIRPGRDRSIPLIQIASHYLACKVFNALGPKLTSKAEELFEVFNRNNDMKSPAGVLLNRAVKDRFSPGGYWKIKEMEKSQNRGRINQLWKLKASSTYNDTYLIANHPDILISNIPPAKNTTSQRLNVLFFPSNSSVKLVTGYYLPASKTEETFDSFYYDARLKKAIVLQVTTSSSHSMKAGGLKRLKDLGVKKISYVAVTPPMDDFDLPVPHGYTDFVEKVYQLVLESPTGTSFMSSS